MDDVQVLFERLLSEVKALREDRERPLPTVLSKRRAAEELSVSLSKLKGMIRQGAILVCEVGGTTGVPASEIRRIASAVLGTKAPRVRRPRRSSRTGSPKEEAALVRSVLRSRKQS
ncbi:hypothetical protein [Myxococcus sp. CA040A]|uniref:hypothetical protein n=1 Tax=Myxococcus sp. CA040A TaxID=2741738 RepID=UPI00157B1B1C|nr:hypothetical protein [Myxococcus sp. CA040A]NTX07008.1 hypothetical protein [Myxococcus sp. CA040A]